MGPLHQWALGTAMIGHNIKTRPTKLLAMLGGWFK